MLKILLCLVIAAAGTGAGFIKAMTLEQRSRGLEEFITALKIVQAEMQYSLEPLTVLLMRVGKQQNNQAGLFFETCARLLREKRYTDFNNCWYEALEEVYSDSCLTDEDLAVITEVGLELGKTDMENQKSLFARTFSRLDFQKAQSEEEKRMKGRMYKGLGVSVSLLTIILFL